MTEKEREFFRLIRQAIFTNPFDKERLATDKKALELAGEGAQEGVLSRLVHEVTQTLTLLKKRGETLHSAISAEDKELIAYAHLFSLYHQYCDLYDKHILEQIQAGEKSCAVSFAAEALRSLYRAGFVPADALRFFALFFQIRRAFYFISRIVGDSASMQDLRRSLWNNIFSQNISLYNHYLWNRMEDFSTLLFGETGVGKGMTAAAIGRSGFIPFQEKNYSFTESFVAAFTEVNLSQYAQELIESELFGHRKGAFTGAMENHQGVLQRCSPCGAIFLDEIGDVSLPIQIKLLKVLQERKFYPVGSYQTERFSGRVIAATNQDLTRLRQAGAFRDDFYYRLSSDNIEIPPLRKRLTEHPGELTQLLSVVVHRIVNIEEKDNNLVGQIEEYLIASQPENYRWPGNIRELEQCVRQYLLRGTYNWQMERRHNPQDPYQKLAMDMAAGSLSAAEVQSRYCRLLHGKLGTYDAVAKVTALDRRTVKKYVGEKTD